MYKLGTTSKNNLKGVRPNLVSVVESAIVITSQDFTILAGVRSAAEQNALYQRGASQRDGYTSKSMHQIQPSGYGEAVDIVPYHNGKPVWDWDLIYPVCEAMVTASRMHNVDIRWGGCWGYTAIKDMSGSPENWVQEYVRRKMAAGKRAFNDGPHYELL